MTERVELSAIIGDDLSLPNIVSKMVRSKAAWQAFSTYCERVLRVKEEEERTRQAAAAAVAVVSPRAPPSHGDGGSDVDEDE